MITAATPPRLVAYTYTALGDGYFRLEDLARARRTWAEGLAKCPDDDGLKTRLAQEGQPLLDTVTRALSAGRAFRHQPHRHAAGELIAFGSSCGSLRRTARTST